MCRPSGQGAGLGLLGFVGPLDPRAGEAGLNFFGGSLGGLEEATGDLGGGLVAELEKGG